MTALIFFQQVVFKLLTFNKKIVAILKLFGQALKKKQALTSF